MDPKLFEQIYETVARKEPTYDGIYYTAVKTTRIVCRPSCRARTPKPVNVTFYPSLQEAIAAGFRPCKRCRPEEGGKLRPDALLAAQADAVIEREYSRKLTLRMLAQRLRVSPFHLQRVFTAVRGFSPAARLDQVREQAACERLLHTEQPVAEIASSVGFRSHSHFSAWFVQRTGRTPSSYRNTFTGGRTDDKDDVVPSHSEAGE